MPPIPRICATIPVYEHQVPLVRVLAAIRACGLECFLVDDGSGPECSGALAAIAAADPAVHLLRLPRNQGKGAAVRAGLLAASRQNFSHALQIDADGQHALEDIPRFLAETHSSPGAIICGRPQFGPDTPRSRLYGRQLTRLWVSINTLSNDVPDAMCGFRVYPLAVVTDLLEKASLGRRMDFDIEILVRLHWLGVPMRWIDTRICYPADGSSHFRLWLDNLLISRVHGLLFLGMLGRLHRLLARRLVRRGHWRSAA